jgi:hypothetical protein
MRSTGSSITRSTPADPTDCTEISNLTVNESAKLKSGSGYVQPYNALAPVEAKHQIIVHAEPIGIRLDYPVASNRLSTASPCRRRAAETYRPKCKSVAGMRNSPKGTHNPPHACKRGLQ